MLLMGVGAGPSDSSRVFAQTSVRVACTETALLAAIGQANVAGGGTITFNCRATTIPMIGGLGTIQSNVIVDGEDRNIVLEYTTSFAGCLRGDNGIGGPAIAHLRERNSAIRNLTFKYYLESLQVIGPNNVVERNVFLGHVCSDDALSTTNPQALNTTIRDNHMQDYVDKAFQMSYGSGTIEGNTFIDSLQPIRGPYDNSQGGTFVIRSNLITTTGNRAVCSGVNIDGNYHIIFESNTVKCFRGLRLGGSTQAIVRGNLIEGNPREGILIGDNAVASLSGNTVINNGLSPGSEPPGGVIVWQTGRADLGGGSLVIAGQTLSSAGGNRIQGNGTADVRNLRTGYILKARGQLLGPPVSRGDSEWRRGRECGCRSSGRSVRRDPHDADRSPRRLVTSAGASLFIGKGRPHGHSPAPSNKRCRMPSTSPYRLQSEAAHRTCTSNLRFVPGYPPRERGREHRASPPRRLQRNCMTRSCGRTRSSHSRRCDAPRRTSVGLISSIRTISLRGLITFVNTIDGPQNTSFSSVTP